MAGARYRVARVMVALHPSRTAEPLLDLAAGLARTFGAEITGVFIRDLDFINMASLPGARRLLSHGTVESLTVEMMEEALNRQAAEAERVLSEHAARHRLSASFRTVTTRVSRVIETAEGEPDSVLIVETAGTDVSGPLPLSSLVSRTVSVLALPEAGVLAGPVVAMPHGADAVLERAAYVAQGLDSHLVVIPRSGDSAADIEDKLHDMNVVGTVRQAESEDLAAMLRSLNPGLVVVARTDSAALEAAEALNKPVFVVSA